MRIHHLEASRHEDKFLVPPSKVPILLGELNRIASPDQHTTSDGSYLVTSLYYDTRNLTCYSDQKLGLKTRFKARARWYQEGTHLHLELKLKTNRLIHKVSHPLKTISFESSELPPIFKPYFYDQKLRPKLLTRYKRYAFFIDQVRVTVDTNLEYQSHGKEVWRRDQLVVLEVKTLNAYPQKLSNLLQDLNLHRESFSKYVRAVEALDLV